MELGTIVWIASDLDESMPGAHYSALRAETLAEEIAWARDFGFTGLQLGWRGELTRDPKEIADVCRAAGVEMVALSAYTDFLNPEHNWPCRDAAAVEDMVEVAGVMGIDTIVTWGGFGSSSDEEARRRVRVDLAGIVGCAEDLGVKVALELYDNCVFGTVEQVNQLADELGTSALGVMMDPPNTMKESDLSDLPGYYGRIIKGSGNRLFAAHAKDVLFQDGQRRLPGPGEGQQDYVAYIRALADAGFDGHLIIEHVTKESVGPARDFVAAKMKEALG